MLRRKFFFQNLCFHKFLTLRSQNCVASDFTRKYFLLSKRVSIFSNFGKNVAESSPRSYAKVCFVFSQIIESTRRKNSTSFLIFSKMKLVMLKRSWVYLKIEKLVLLTLQIQMHILGTRILSGDVTRTKLQTVPCCSRSPPTDNNTNERWLSLLLPILKTWTFSLAGKIDTP